MKNQREKLIQKMENTLRLGGKSEKTILNYSCAIKYFYSVNFNINLNDKLLPHSKLAKKLPKTLDKDTFIKILNEGKNLEHKCWLLLGYCSGLRVEEVSIVKIEDIDSTGQDICFHSLRHSFSSNFIKAGGDPFVLKSMLGHSSMSTTSIYVHIGRDFNNLKGVKYVKQ